MINTRLCKTQQEVELGMLYENNKAKLSKLKSIKVILEMKIQGLNNDLLNIIQQISQLEQDIKNFEIEYGDLIVKEGV